MHLPTLFARRIPAAGSTPGTIAPAPEALPPRISVIRYDTHTLDERRSPDAADALALLRDPAWPVAWVDVQGVGDRHLLEQFGRELGLHRLLVADIGNVGQRAKVEDYDDVLFVVVRMTTIEESGRVRSEQVSVVVGDRWVVSFQETYGDCLDPLRDRIRSGRQMLRAGGSGYLAVMMIDAIVDGYFPVLERVGDELEEIEAEVISQSGSRTALGRVYRIKRELMMLRRSTWPLRDALSHLLRDGHPLLSPEVRPYLRDAADHAMQVVDVLETYRELASSFVDVHLSMAANRTNEIMRVLTIIATIFIPLTFLAGVYGMNFDTRHAANMPELGWRYGYVAFWLVSLAVGAGLLFIFRQLGWLTRRARSEAPDDD